MGKKIKELLPLKIDLNKGVKTYESEYAAEIERELTERKELNNEINEPKYQEVKINPNKKKYDPNDTFKVKCVSGGYAHTAAITGTIHSL